VARQIRLLLLSVLIVTTSTQPAFLLGSAFFQIGPELGLGPVGLGALSAAFFLTASLTSPPLGRWVERVGWRRAVRLNLAASAVIMLAIAAAARSVWSLATLLVLSAAVYGVSNPAANLALARNTNPARAATIFGIKHAGIPASTLLAGLAVPLVVVGSGWRVAFVVAACLVAPLLALVPRVEGERRADVATTPGRGRPLDRAALIRLAAVAGLGAVAAAALGTFLVSAAVAVGFTEAGAGWLQFAGSAVTITVRIVAGVVADARGVTGFGGLFWLIGLGAVTFALLPLPGPFWFAVLVLVAFATGWSWPGLLTYTVVDADRSSAASASAITQAGTFVGAGGGPLLLGAVTEWRSFDAAWMVVAVALATGAVMIRTAQRRVEGRPA
jgi:MFS family permease